MKVTNQASFPIIAFCFDENVGYGADTLIQPGQSEDVLGPYLGEMGGGSCRVHVPGEIICSEEPDSGNSFQVNQNNQLHLATGDKGVTVRHHLDDPEEQVLLWRRNTISPDELERENKCRSDSVRLTSD